MRGSFLERLAAEAARRAGPVRRLERDLVRLTEGFTGRRGGRPADYFRSAGMRRAYLASLAVPNAARAHFVLGRARAGLRKGERGLDVGAGTGSAALALAARSDPDSEIVLVDRSGPALAEAQRLFAALFPKGPRVETIRAEVGRGARGLPDGEFATVVAGHLLNELLPARGRGLGPVAGFVRALAARVADTGRLVLIEPAQRIPSRALGEVRKELLATGWRPLGPCTHAAACPVLAPRARDWCVVDVPFDRPPVVRAVDDLLGTNRSRLTVSWLGVSRGAEPPGGRTVEVLSQPMHAGRDTLIYLCGIRGRAVAKLPRPPNPPLPRGAIVRLPKGAKPAGRDRTGAPLFVLGPDEIERA